MGIKVLSVFGTRPEAVKMGPVVKAIEKTQSLNGIVCVTAQHREMLDQVLNVFKIKPDYDLNIMKSKQTLTDITTQALKGLEKIILLEKPDLVLVHGDTTTTFAAALAAYYHKVKVGHVEAGLRTFNKYEPYPEEINRKLAGALADLHFAPTKTSKANLLAEGVDENKIFVTGNTAIDALKSTISDNYTFSVDKLNQIVLKNKRIITMTAHRRENWGEPLENICRAVKKLASEFPDIEVIYAVHLNPIVQKTVHSILDNVENVHLLDPIDFTDMHNLMNKSYLVLTDSGGIQEEVPSLGKPVLVLRNVTERPEGIAAGTLKLAGTDEDTVFSMAKELLENDDIYNKMANAANPYGDGYASERIVDAIIRNMT